MKVFAPENWSNKKSLLSATEGWLLIGSSHRDLRAERWKGESEIQSLYNIYTLTQSS